MLVKISTENLRVGMYVVDTGLPWTAYPFLYSKPGKVHSQKQIEALLREGYTEVFIDTSMGERNGGGLESDGDSNLESKLLAEARATAPSARAKAPLAVEVAIAQRVYQDSIKLAREFTNDIRMGSPVNLNRASNFIASVIGSVSRNSDAMISLTKLRAYDEYTYTHSVNVCVLSLAFGKCLELPDDKLHLLGLGALFHDVGKASIPAKVLNKPGRLTPEEFDVIKQHPRKGRIYMEAQKGLNGTILRAIAEHHEKYDGSGYPEGLAGNEINVYARIIAVADVYDALTSERVYKKGMPANKALSIIFSMKDTDFFPCHAEKFIKCLGIYPVGSLVKLNNEETAVVVESNPTRPLLPVVKIVFDRALRPRTPEIVDLAHSESAEGYKKPAALRIVTLLDHKALHIDPTPYLLS